MSIKRQSGKGASRLTKRHPDHDVLVRTYAVTHPPNLHLTARSYEAWGQLVFAAEGVMEILTDAGSWVVPAHRAVWIPAGLTHSVHMTGTVVVRSLFFQRGALAPWETPNAINVSPLLRELILYATRRGLLRRGNASDEALLRVIVDQLELLDSVPLQLPSPTDPRARSAATFILRNIAEPDVLDRVAERAGASKRTLERLFWAETSMSLGAWRARARLIESLRGLARGHDVTQVAFDVGYRSPSAFIAAFREQLGTTPARYFAVDAQRSASSGLSSAGT